MNNTVWWSVINIGMVHVVFQGERIADTDALW